MVVDGHLLEESMTRVAWMVLGSTSGEPAVNGEPPMFLVFEPRADDLLYMGAVSIPPSPGGKGPRSPLGVFPTAGRCIPQPILGGVTLRPGYWEVPLFELP